MVRLDVKIWWEDIFIANCNISNRNARFLSRMVLCDFSLYISITYIFISRLGRSRTSLRRLPRNVCKETKWHGFKGTKTWYTSRWMTVEFCGEIAQGFGQGGTTANVTPRRRDGCVAFPSFPTAYCDGYLTSWRPRFDSSVSFPGRAGYSGAQTRLWHDASWSRA